MSHPKSRPNAYEGWVSVYEAGTDYEADLVRDRLDDAGLDAVLLTQRDHVFNLNVGDLAAVHVLVKPEQEAQAREIIGTSFSDEELEEAAMTADPHAPPAHTPEEEAMLDSGGELFRFIGDDEEEEEK